MPDDHQQAGPVADAAINGRCVLPRLRRGDGGADADKQDYRTHDDYPLAWRSAPARSRGMPNTVNSAHKRLRRRGGR